MASAQNRNKKPRSRQGLIQISYIKYCQRTYNNTMRSRFERIYLELTNACNFSCAFCPRLGMDRPVQMLDQKAAEQVLIEVAAERLATDVEFHVLGEPSLYPHFFEILSLTEKLGLRPSLVTNGFLLENEFGHRLQNHCLHQLILSIQTPDEETFIHRQAPIDFASYRYAILEFLAKAYHAWPKASFSLRFLNTALLEKARNLDSLYGPACSTFSGQKRALKSWLRQLYRILGIDEIPTASALDRLNSLSLQRFHRILVHPRIRFDIWHMLDWSDWSQQEDAPQIETGECRHHQEHFAVLSNGEVVLCCLDINGQTSLGNVYDNDLTTILNSPQARWIDEQFQQQQIPLAYCRRCLGHWQEILSAVRPGKTNIQATHNAIIAALENEVRLW